MKRFTDAELAAEWHRAVTDSIRAAQRDGGTYEATMRQTTIGRFATLPHFDEGTV